MAVRQKVPNVRFVRPEIKAREKSYKLIDDCIMGQERIKSRTTDYLPQPNAEDKSVENVARYKAYVDRAVFYNATKRTLNGLTGQVFLRKPVIEVPTLLDTVVADATGGGVPVEQLAKRVVQQVLAFGRIGMHVDYPKTEVVASRAELESGNIRPVINTYKAIDVINWRTTTVGSRVILSLVVIRETYAREDDGFEMTPGTQYKVLRLVDGLYQIEIWKLDTDQGKPGEVSFPTDSVGNRLKEIPFMFVGSENNDSYVDEPPIYDLAELNIAHYRNSADYEESSFITGQPTPVFTGLTEEWVTNVLKGVIAFGARAAIPLPPGGDAKLLQANPNIQPKEAMEQKERQMVALGAKLVEQASVQRTATEAMIENTSDNSILGTVTGNVASAFAWAFNQCGKFVGTEGQTVKFELNTEFDLVKLSPQERDQTIKEWQAGALAFEEMRDNLRRAGVATLDDEDARSKITNELAATAQANATLDPNDNNGGV